MWFVKRKSDGFVKGFLNKKDSDFQRFAPKHMNTSKKDLEFYWASDDAQCEQHFTISDGQLCCYNKDDVETNRFGAEKYEWPYEENESGEIVKFNPPL